ncbi:MAG TPA: hypothetical protein VG015_00035 [Candidatus Dormibacteraeota bacterium]|jgi:hypothetical protein|nr:hypothetical protein [Candidatus Dormibacteraeota bacterium]
MASTRFLTVYDYGQGGVWRVVLAESRAQVEWEFSLLTVMDGPPSWMTAAELDVVKVVDIDSGEDEFLNSLRREP